MMDTRFLKVLAVLIVLFILVQVVLFVKSWHDSKTVLGALSDKKVVQGFKSSNPRYDVEVTRVSDIPEDVRVNRAQFFENISLSDYRVKYFGNTRSLIVFYDPVGDEILSAYNPPINELPEDYTVPILVGIVIILVFIVGVLLGLHFRKH